MEPQRHTKGHKEKNNYTHARVSEMLFRSGFPGCSMKKSWNENKNLGVSSTEEFNKLTIKQKNKYSSVKIRDNPCKSVAKKFKMRIAGK